MAGHQASRPGQETKRSSPRPGPVALLQSLERVREGVRQRLDRIEELAALRALIEPELASRALPRAHFALIDRLAAINASLGDAAQNHDAVGYIRLNLEFHRTLYLRAQAPAMLAVLETIWLQLGPTMRAVYQRMRRNEAPRHHRMILAALRAGDEPALRLAVRTDVTQGLRHLLPAPADAGR